MTSAELTVALADIEYSVVDITEGESSKNLCLLLYWELEVVGEGPSIMETV